MKHRPILFSTPMVQAIMGGNKTQTRRVVKPQPTGLPCGKCVSSTDKEDIGTYGFADGERITASIKCPYGQIGDVLWVREAWRLISWDFEDGSAFIDYKEGMPIWIDLDEDGEEWLLNQVELLEKKGCISAESMDEDGHYQVLKHFPWKPSIHMPKAAARIFLRITDIRVERLQDISEEDAIAEGIGNAENGRMGYKDYLDSDSATFHAKQSFESLWQSINGAESWDENPWVWVITFESIEKPENFIP
jgi:hypothetical protein